MQTICEKPRIILNPLALELIAEHGNYFIRGKRHDLFNSKRVLYAFKTKNLNPHSFNIQHYDVDSCFVLDSITKERYPLYLEVPCGHCSLCLNAKVNTLVSRCKMESQLYNCKPLFITLTYDDLHKKECGVCLRDTQLFFKRLRINLYRAGYRQKIRYLLVSEYGAKRSRPHYHALLWNLQQNDLVSYREIGEIIEKSWHNGFIMYRLCDPSDDKTFRYTSKYICKGSNVPAGLSKNFMVCSNRGGSIGAAFIDRLARQFVRQLDTKCKYVNKWNNKVEEVVFSRYVLNRAMPSFCRSLGSYTKSSIRSFLMNVQILKSRNSLNYLAYAEKAEKVRNLFGKYFYIPNLSYSDFQASVEDSSQKIIGSLLRSEVYIDRALARGEQYFNQCWLIGQKRKKFLDKLFLYQQEVDIKNRAYNIGRLNRMSYCRELLLTPF